MSKIRKFIHLLINLLIIIINKIMHKCVKIPNYFFTVYTRPSETLENDLKAQLRIAFFK